MLERDDDSKISHPALVPGRRKPRIDEALILRQCRDSLAVGIIERELQRVEIGLLARGALGLGNRGDAVLVEQPLQRDLRRAGAVFLADSDQRLVEAARPWASGA
jgi:hypothetical protein